MTSQQFIFSNKPTHRLIRHLIFWLAFSLHFFIQNLIVGTVNEALKPRTPAESLINISYFLPIYVISTYIFIELIIPAFLFKGRYAIFFVSTAGLLTFIFVSCYLSGLLYEHIEWKMPYQQITFAANKYHAIVNGLFVSFMILGITGGIKISKKWFQKQRENEALAKQKIKSELQLLKIQINPRFLFHSLNTVKQNILNDSPRSPQLILQISDLLSYILYESEKEFVLLEKELGIIKEYLGLEENNSNQNIQINTIISGNVADKYITPLILLSIIETSFEYFIEKQQQKISLSLSIEVKDNHLDLIIAYSVLNYNPRELSELNEKLAGARKQLQNLYQDNYDLKIESTSINTSIILQQIPLHNDNPLQEVSATTLKDIYENV